MKKYSLILVLMVFNSQANDSIIQLLEDNGVSTDTLISSETEHNISGERLKVAVSNLLQQELLVQYAVTDHDSEKGQCLKQKITAMFKQPEPLISNEPPVILGHCGGVFDPPGVVNAMPINPSTGISNAQLHQLKHEFNVVMAKRTAINICNQQLNSHTPSIPVFTGPQNLVDIIYNLGTPSRSYHLAEGMVFKCLAPPSVSGH